jgi:predicted phosphodiesterase
MKEKVLFVGDTHGEIELINKAVILADKRRCDRIIQVGDFGFFPNIYPEFIESLNSKIPFYFIDGNHDDHERLPHEAESIVSLRELGYEVENFYYIPRGLVMNWGESNLLFMGGAKSIDKAYRTQGIDWWDNEEINYGDYQRASDNQYLWEKVDIIVSHECPRTEAVDYECDYSSKAIGALVELYNPWLLIHGHHHRNYMLKRGETIIKGLGCKEEDMFEVIWI